VDFTLPEELEALRRTIRDFVDREYPPSRALELEAQEYQFPDQLWDDLGKLGVHAIGIDEAYGGSGGDVVTQVVVARELARSLAGLTWTWGISSFAGGKSVGLYGSPEQKERFLPALARGDIKVAIAMTEPGGGTDVLGAMRTRAERVDGGWRITGSKVWSTAARESDYILLLARSDQDPPKKTQGLTLFLVPQPSEGMTLRAIPKIGMRCIPSYEIFLDDVFVPDDLVLGEEGRAWYQLLGTLNNERIVLSGLALGILDGIVEHMLAWVNQREVFGRSLGGMQAVQHQVADVLIERAKAELLTMNAAWLQSQGRECGREANMAKLVASEAANHAADVGIQLMGGMGYSMETQFQRYWRDSRIYRIAPIANEMVKNTLAEAAGLPRSF
jgi:acyl-CoA dehydrogenase